MSAVLGPPVKNKAVMPETDEESREAFDKGGFNFDLCRRNAMLASTNATMPKPMKTGTTICGVVYNGGVVLGADTRATADTEVADKNCAKIHYLAPNIHCCGAGTAADTEKATAMVASQLDLLRLSTGTQSRVVAAVTLLKRMLFKYQGHVSAALVLGGCDAVAGPQLYQIYPHGSTGRLPYVTMGSGSLAAMSVFETNYRDGMEESDAVELVKDAIFGGIFNDLGSGSNCDVAVIKMDGTTDLRRGYRKPNDLAAVRAAYARPQGLVPLPGATAILSERVEIFTEEENNDGNNGPPAL